MICDKLFDHVGLRPFGKGRFQYLTSLKLLSPYYGKKNVWTSNGAGKALSLWNLYIKYHVLLLVFIIFWKCVRWMTGFTLWYFHDTIGSPECTTIVKREFTVFLLGHSKRSTCRLSVRILCYCGRHMWPVLPFFLSVPSFFSYSDLVTEHTKYNIMFVARTYFQLSLIVNKTCRRRDFRKHFALYNFFPTPPRGIIRRFSRDWTRSCG